MAFLLLRSMNGLVPDITIEEQHQDQYVITDHPVEGDGTNSGTVVSDHAYKLPSEVIVTYAWAPSGPLNSASSPTFLNDLYAQILAIGDTFTLFNVYTGKRIYTNMLLGMISTTTDKETENVLVIRMLCRQINIATVTTVSISEGGPTLDPDTQQYAEKTLPLKSMGVQQGKAAPNANVESIQFATQYPGGSTNAGAPTGP